MEEYVLRGITLHNLSQVILALVQLPKEVVGRFCVCRSHDWRPDHQDDFSIIFESNADPLKYFITISRALNLQFEH